MSEGAQSSDLLEERKALLEEIYAAFDGVTLGDGISWAETDALDGGRGRFTKEDKKIDHELFGPQNDWRKLVDDPHWTEDPGGGGFSFIDAEGFRYYMPVAMVRNINGDLGDSLLYNLRISKAGRFRTHSLELIRMLNPRQCSCVKLFLQYMCRVYELQNDSYLMQDCIDTMASYWYQF